MISLVTVIKNKSHQLKPKNYEHCPRYKNCNEKVFCVVNEKNKCYGIDDNSIVKNIKGDLWILQCNYWCD